MRYGDEFRTVMKANLELDREAVQTIAQEPESSATVDAAHSQSVRAFGDWISAIALQKPSEVKTDLREKSRRAEREYQRRARRFGDQLRGWEMSGHTPGPWHIGSMTHQHVEHGADECGLCDRAGPLLCVTTSRASYPDKFSDTVHVHLWPHSAAQPGYGTITADDGTEVVGMYDYEEGGVCTSLADARLIAAAPDMLAALRGLLTESYDLFEALDGERQQVFGPIFAQVAGDAAAAIAKAEGP